MYVYGFQNWDTSFLLAKWNMRSFLLLAIETFFIIVFLSLVDLLLHRLSLAACGPGQNSVKIFLSEAAFWMFFHGHSWRSWNLLRLKNHWFGTEIIYSGASSVVGKVPDPDTDHLWRSFSIENFFYKKSCLFTDRGSIAAQKVVI